MTSFSIGLSYLLVVSAGASLAFQQILNANLRSELGSPWWAGCVSYFVGTAAILAVALLTPGPRLSVSSIGNTSSWMSWTGGVFGAVFVAVAIFMVPRLGAATVLALTVVGQMIGSIVFDHFGLLGIPQYPVNLTRLVGAAFLITGVLLISK